MHLVQVENGIFEIRWTWLPYWLAVSPAMTREIRVAVRDIAVLNGMPPDEESLAALDEVVITMITARFPIPGLEQYLRAALKVGTTPSPAADPWDAETKKRKT